MGYPKTEKRNCYGKTESDGNCRSGKKLPANISGGQQQRCAIARALASDRDMILADEPTGALDKKTGVEIMETLRSVNDIGKTLIVITHDEKIADMGDRILNIEDGRLI